MIDLSFLTEEEQEKVLAVLRRDAELKKAEEQRVRNLQQTVIDRDRLKYMTGEWFYETKQLRHQDRIHGSDIIRASIKHTHKPLTILELSQIVPEKSSFVSSENKEVFVPAVLCGILQEPYMQLGNETRNQNQDPVDTLHDIPKLVVTSPTKKRKNPFNSEVHESHTFEEKDEAVDQIQSPNEEPLPSSDSCISYTHSLTQDPFDRLVTQNESVPMPVPDETAVSSSAQDCLVEVDGPGGRQTNSAALRGILKQLSTCSSTESLVSRQDLQTTVTLDSPTESGIDRKQVRFSFTTGQSIEEWQDGNEMGEHSMLDGEFTTLSEAENNKDFENAGSMAVGPHSPSLNENQVDSEESGELKCRLEEYLEEQEAGQHQAPSDVDNDSTPEFPDAGVSGVICAEEGSGGSVHQETEPEEVHQSPAEATQSPTEEHNVPHQKLPGHSTDIYVEATSDTKPSSIGSSKGPSHANLPKPKQRLLGLFRRDKNKTSQVQSPQKEEVKIAKQKESGNTQNVSHGDVHIIVDRPASVKQEATLPEMAELRTLQLTALQKTPFNETVTSVNADTDVQLPEGLTNLNASCERENNGSKVIFTREDARHKNMAKTGIEGSYSPQTNSDVESMNNNLSDTAGTYQERYLSPQVDSNLLLDLSKEDGTYRANPVLIFSEESSDDCLTDSETKPHLSETQEDVISPVPSAVALNIPKQDHDISVPLPRQFSSCPEEDRPVKISELKHFWEKEYTGPRVVSATVRDASIGSIRSKKLVFPDLQPSLDSKSDTQAQQRPLSPEKTPGTKDQDDEVRRSPSKTCHPRALPRESSSPTSSRLEGSPLRTFRIDIDPQTTVVEEPQVIPTPVPRQRKSPSHEALQSATQPSPDTPSGPLPLHPDSRGSSFDNLNTQQSSTSSSSSTRYKKASEKKSGPFTRLARSFVPQDYQHYLGPQEKSHVPPFNQEEAGESDAVHRPQNALRDVVGNQNDKPTEGNTPRIINQDITTKAWSLSRASSGSHDETSGPVMSALKRLSSRSMSSSKSLENLSSEKTSSLSPSALTPSNSTQMISSVSVPALQQDETDSDSFSETNLGWRRNTGSSTSNMSLSSGMASMSSVSGSIISIYPGDLEVQGSIQFAVNYIQKLGEFHIFVVHCRDLAIADAKKTRSDPYVKCYLVPDETKLGKRKTIVIKKTLNPTYNEILRFKIKMESLKVQNLNVSVWHNDTFGRNSFLGEVDLDLSEWDFGNTQINEYALKARVSVLLPPPPCRLIDSRGHMRLALRFLPQTSHSKRSSRMETGEVQIWVKDCKNLPQIRGVIMDPFVKCTVLPDTSRKSRQKTRVVKRTANPMFNHTMVYDGFRPDDLREACVEITVWDHDRLNNHYIGGLRLGLGTGKSYGLDVLWMDSTTDEANLWQRMLQSDGEWVEDALPLRMFVLAKSASK